MRKIIQDQFTELKVSRQRKWQLRKAVLGLCQICGDPNAIGLGWCKKCAVKHREYQRKIRHAKRRYNNARSYKI